MTRQKIVTLQANVIKRHNQPEDNLYVNTTPLCDAIDVHTERTVTPKTARALTSKSLLELQWRRQRRRLIDGCSRERRFPVVFATKRSLQKRQKDSCEHTGRLRPNTRPWLVFARKWSTPKSSRLLDRARSSWCVFARNQQTPKGRRLLDRARVPWYPFPTISTMGIVFYMIVCRETTVSNG